MTPNLDEPATRPARCKPLMGMKPQSTVRFAAHFNGSPIARRQSNSGNVDSIVPESNNVSYSMNSEDTESSLLMRNIVSASRPATDKTRIFLHACASARSGMLSVTTSSSMVDS